jgi:hypothetical protein
MSAHLTDVVSDLFEILKGEMLGDSRCLDPSCKSGSPLYICVCCGSGRPSSLYIHRADYCAATHLSGVQHARVVRILGVGIAERVSYGPYGPDERPACPRPRKAPKMQTARVQPAADSSSASVTCTTVAERISNKGEKARLTSASTSRQTPPFVHSKIGLS